MKKTIVIHHSADFDGLFCREIARKFLGNENVEYIGWDFADERVIIPDGDVGIYVLDLPVDRVFGFAYKPGDADGAAPQHPAGLVWIDHHKTSIDTHPKSIPGYRIDGVAACRLAWQWFNIHAELFHPTAGSFSVPLPEKQAFIDRTVSEPLSVRLAGEYDIWDKRDPHAELFQHGLRSQNLDLMWSLLLAEPRKIPISEIEGLIDVGHPPDLRPDGTVDACIPWVETLLRQGEAIQYNSTQQNESIIKAHGFDVDFEGLKFLCCNHARFNSFLFTAGIKPHHEALMGFCWTGKQWKFSLYHAPGKEQHDLSAIAKKFGGGGHRGACGFMLNNIPFIST